MEVLLLTQIEVAKAMRARGGKYKLLSGISIEKIIQAYTSKYGEPKEVLYVKVGTFYEAYIR